VVRVSDSQCRNSRNSPGFDASILRQWTLRGSKVTFLILGNAQTILLATAIAFFRGGGGGAGEVTEFRRGQEVLLNFRFYKLS
jgi:hypothetical protein